MVNPTRSKAKRPHESAAAQAFEGCSPEPAGRPLEVPGNGVPRWMVAAAPLPRRGTESGLQASSSALPAALADGAPQCLERIAELVFAVQRHLGLPLVEHPVGEGVLTGGVRGVGGAQ